MLFHGRARLCEFAVASLGLDRSNRSDSGSGPRRGVDDHGSRHAEVLADHFGEHPERFGLTCALDDEPRRIECQNHALWAHLDRQCMLEDRGERGMRGA